MKEELENELSDLSPFLADLKKQQANDPFKTPKFYFDNLTDKVLAEAKSVEKTTIVATKGTPQYKSLFEHLKSLFAPNFEPKLAMAFGSLALVLAGSWYALTRKTTEIANDSPQIAATQLPVEPIATQNLDSQTIDLAPRKNVTKDALKSATDGDITDNMIDMEAGFSAPKLPNTEGSLLTHPESGLTEEELESYLVDTAEEGDLEGSDNKF